MPHDIRNARLRDTCYAMLRAAALALVAGCLASCAVAPVADAGPPRIWDVSAQRFVDESTLDARLVAARYRLLGEVHDNPAHHRLRARTIAAIAAGGRRPAVVMEQLDFGVEGALQEAQRRGADA